MSTDLDLPPADRSRPEPGRPARHSTALPALVGIITGLVTFAVATVVSVLFGAESPFIAVGSAAIDLAPPGFKALVITLFGTGDKTFLFILLAALVLVISGLVGILQVRRAPFGTVVLALVTFLAAAATVSRAGASAFEALPTIAGAVVGWLVLRALVARLDRWWSAVDIVARRDSSPAERDSPLVPLVPLAGSRAIALERRGFLRLAIVAGAASLVVAAGSGISAAASNTAAAVRAKIKLPKPASPAPTIPAGAELDIPGLSSYIIPNADFYRIDTALQVPNIVADDWKLKVTGMVDNEVEVTFAELLKLPLTERIITLTCVSQEVGGNLIGNASWLGYPIRELLAKAGPKAGADMVLSRSIDGFTASSPLAVLQDPGTDALLAVGMNGEPLPPEHGFPVRMVVPGLYGYVSATKWVVELKVTTYKDDQAYWTPRGYSAKAPIKLSSRIDTPHDGYQVKAGTVAIAGVAWHQHVGISKVEVKVDDGAWKSANLARVVTVDSWLQWSYAWEAKKGDHTITVRATDEKGVVQTARQADIIPNGSTGLQSIRVQVA